MSARRNLIAGASLPVVHADHRNRALCTPRGAEVAATAASPLAGT